jgi:integrase
MTTIPKGYKLDKGTVRLERESLPGVWKLLDRGFLVRGRVSDPRSGKMKDIRKVLPDVPNAAAALAWLEEEKEKIRTGRPMGSPTKRVSFKAFALRHFQDRIASRKILSAAGREKVASIHKNHLFKAKFASLYVDTITPEDYAKWQSEYIVPLVGRGEYAPSTAETWISELEATTNAFVAEYGVALNPCLGLKPVDSRGHRTYTEEQPNALTPEQLMLFLPKFKVLYPQFYAFVHCGFILGLRPCTLRPLRRQGPEADIKWEQRLLLIRRSHSRKQEVMNCTKTSKGGADGDQRIGLDDDTMAVLRWHLDRYLWSAQRDCDLLFPSRTGGFQARSALDIPFRKTMKAIGLEDLELTPLGMRRTYQNLCRRAKLPKTVQMAICGHRTEEMSDHYEIVPVEEQREALAKVYDLLNYREKVVQGGEASTAPKRHKSRSKTG